MSLAVGNVQRSVWTITSNSSFFGRDEYCTKASRLLDNQALAAKSLLSHQERLEWRTMLL